MNRQNLLISITDIIKDYRQGEIPPITPQHVNRWVCQFEEKDQLIILYEMNHLLNKYYVSEIKAKIFLSAILKSEEIFGKNPSFTIPHTQFLSIQRKGNSQKDLIKLMNNITTSEYGLNILKSIVKPETYIYLDDCLFSGNTLIHDLELWLKNDVNNKSLYLIFLGFYRGSINYLTKKIKQITSDKINNTKIIYFLKFENNFYNNQEYECLWSRVVTDNQYVNIFCSTVINNAQSKGWTPRLFRQDNIPFKETLFSCPQHRDIVEKAFLKKGAYICSLPKNRQNSMRPMGYEYLESLGFGSMFITYRNIANNCPLVLWWGDTNYPQSHPFSKWYPLFPRKVNEQSSIMVF